MGSGVGFGGSSAAQAGNSFPVVEAAELAAFEREGDFTAFFFVDLPFERRNPGENVAAGNACGVFVPPPTSPLLLLVPTPKSPPTAACTGGTAEGAGGEDTGEE